MTTFQRVLFVGLIGLMISVTTWATDNNNTININQASSKKLAKLHGIGQKKAKSIVHYRQLHGQFHSVQSLQNIKGIGSNITNKLVKDGRVTLGAKQNPKHHGSKQSDGHAS